MTKRFGPIDGNEQNTALENWFPFSAEELKRLRLAAQELGNIVNAKRFNREMFRDDTEWADWVQSRCRHVLRATEPNGYGMPGDAIWLPAPAAQDESVLAKHSGTTDRREWHSVSEWLYPGEEIVSRSAANARKS